MRKDWKKIKMNDFQHGFDPFRVKPKISFFAALAGVFKGVSAFPLLLSQSFFMALWHFFLLSVLCSLFFTVSVLWRNSELIKDTEETFYQVYGDVVSTSDNEFFPSKCRDAANALNIGNWALLCYTPYGMAPAMPESIKIPDVGYFPHYIYWSPRSLMWIKPVYDEEGKVGQFLYVNLDVLIRRVDVVDLRQSLTVEELRVKLDSTTVVEGGVEAGGPGKVLACNKLFKDIYGLAVVFSLWGAWICSFVLPLLYISLFVTVFFMMGLRSRRVVSFSEMFMCAMYASMPAVLIMTLFLSFGIVPGIINVFITIGVTIYFFIIVTWIEHERRVNSGEVEANDETK